MKRKIFILIAIVNIILLSACSLGSDKMIILDDSDKKADTRMKDILDALKDKDKDALKSLFSKKALSDADDMEGQLDYLFDFFQGTVESWVRTGFSGDDSIEDGKKSTKLRSLFTVKTDKDEYRFFLIDYSKDTINPDNKGLYTLRVIKKADEDTQFTNYEDMEIAGIYQPEDDKNTGSTPSTKH